MKDPNIKIPHTIYSDGIYGIFRPKGMTYGANGIRKKLCTQEVYARHPDGRLRSPKESSKYITQLYSEKLEDILSNSKTKARELRIKDAEIAWIASLAARRIKPQTLDTYSRSMKWYLQILPNHYVKEFKQYYYDNLLNELKGTPATINKHLTVYSMLYNWLLDRELITKRVKFPRIAKGKQKPKIYSPEELAAMEGYIRSRLFDDYGPTRMAAKSALRVFIMAESTGMRRGEIWSLPLANIHLRKRLIYVRNQPNWTIKEKHEKDISISDALFDWLSKDTRLSTERYYLDNGEGKQYYSHIDSMTQYFRVMRKSLGISGQKSIHGFRSTLITRVIQTSGIGIAQKIAGHSKITTTELYHADDPKINLDALNKISRKSAKNSQKIHSK